MLLFYSNQGAEQTMVDGLIKQQKMWSNTQGYRSRYNVSSSPCYYIKMSYLSSWICARDKGLSEEWVSSRWIWFTEAVKKSGSVPGSPCYPCCRRTQNKTVLWKTKEGLDVLNKGVIARTALMAGVKSSTKKVARICVNNKYTVQGASYIINLKQPFPLPMFSKTIAEYTIISQ